MHKRKESAENDIGILQQIMEANPAAGADYLEYLVVQKRNMASHSR